MSGCASSHVSVEGIYAFDARGVAKRLRHAAIFGAIDVLTPGETMRFCNDHNPLPLLEQLLRKYGAGIEVKYQSHEPGAIVIDFVRK